MIYYSSWKWLQAQLAQMWTCYVKDVYVMILNGKIFNQQSLQVSKWILQATSTRAAAAAAATIAARTAQHGKEAFCENIRIMHHVYSS